jgi:hypothetical protein
MSDRIFSRASRIADLPSFMPWLVAVGVYVLLVALGPRLLGDPDTYSHVALGRWILDHRAVPTGDPFSETMRGAHWLAFEWLSEVAYAGAYALGGWAAVAALAAAAAAAAFGQLTRFLLRQWPPVPTLIAMLAALVLTSPHILARPHLLALPLMVGWVAALIRAVDTGRPPPWHMIPLMTLWANLHGSFSFGLVMIGPIVCEALCDASRSERWRVARQWMLFAALALAAACLNPYGPQMILVTLHTAMLGDALRIVTEWQPQDFSRPDAFEIVMLASFGYALYHGVKLPPLRILMLFGVLQLSLSQARHADLLGLLAPLFLARPLARQFGALAASPGALVTRCFSAWPAVATGLLLVAVTAVLVARDDIAPAANITPARALKSFDVAKVGPILNDYDFGGYLDFVGIAPFVDGRAELYGRDFILRYHNAVSLENLPDFLRLLDEYRIGVTLLAPTTPAVALLDRLPGWQRVYADNVAVVHERRADGDATDP